MTKRKTSKASPEVSREEMFQRVRENRPVANALRAARVSSRRSIANLSLLLGLPGSSADRSARWRAWENGTETLTDPDLAGVEKLLGVDLRGCPHGSIIVPGHDGPCGCRMIGRIEPAEPEDEDGGSWDSSDCEDDRDARRPAPLPAFAAPALVIACPGCDAPVGAYCVNADNKPFKRPYLHKVRTDTALMQEAMLSNVKENDGAEIPRDQWPIAEMLVKRELITLGGARGPGGDWKRAEPAYRVPFGNATGNVSLNMPDVSKLQMGRTPGASAAAWAAYAFTYGLAITWAREGYAADSAPTARTAYELLAEHGVELPPAPYDAAGVRREPERKVWRRGVLTAHEEALCEQMRAAGWTEESRDEKRIVFVRRSA